MGSAAEAIGQIDFENDEMGKRLPRMLQQNIYIKQRVHSLERRRKPEINIHQTVKWCVPSTTCLPGGETPVQDMDRLMTECSKGPPATRCAKGALLGINHNSVTIRYPQLGDSGREDILRWYPEVNRFTPLLSNQMKDVGGVSQDGDSTLANEKRIMTVRSSSHVGQRLRLICDIIYIKENSPRQMSLYELLFGVTTATEMPRSIHTADGFG